jgi:two-component system sporulation sensor kinase A
MDRGPGIPRKELKRVFEPFYTTRQSGSGLGLYLTRRIVGEMGGTISMGDGEGEGTVVTIDLPRRPTE